ncbi:MAG: S8 family serine peptidase, partial [Bacteroidota bacterium]
GNSTNLPIANFSSRGPSTCGGMNSLLIKPEVSAPGVNVRSCGLDGTYNQKSGTSMAAPHVCGAILLLKEAFPELTGTELKLALYFSCTDLGAVGEDNTYGMGIIDVEAAFNYLVNEGNTPVSPLAENDVLLIDIDAQRLNCDGIATFDLIIENGGTEPLTSANIQYSLLSDGQVVLNNTIAWTGNLPTGEREAYSILVDDVPEGAYEISAVASDPNGMPDARELNNSVGGEEILISTTAPLFVQPLEMGANQPCAGANTYLFVDFPGQAEIQWYFNATGGAPIATGSTYLVPELASDFTFYVGAIVTSNVGIADREDLTSEVGNNNEGALIFDVFAPFILNSVKVYVETPGFRQVSIRAEDGSVVTQKVFNLTEVGEQRLDLDVSMEEGKNYRMEVSAGEPFYHTTLTNYPYTIGNIVSIKRSGDFVDPQANYYYFYDWEVEHNHVCGRTAYTVDYLSADLVPEARFVPSDLEVNLNVGGVVAFANNSTNSVSYHWDFGDGNTSEDEAPTHTYTQVGTYTVILTAVNAEGCSDVSIETIEVIDVVLSVEQLFTEETIKVFPNPTQDRLDVLFEFN